MTRGDQGEQEDRMSEGFHSTGSGGGEPQNNPAAEAAGPPPASEGTAHQGAPSAIASNPTRPDLPVPDMSTPEGLAAARSVLQRAMEIASRQTLQSPEPSWADERPQSAQAAAGGTSVPAPYESTPGDDSQVLRISSPQTTGVHFQPTGAEASNFGPTWGGLYSSPPSQSAAPLQPTMPTWSNSPVYGGAATPQTPGPTPRMRTAIAAYGGYALQDAATPKDMQNAPPPTSSMPSSRSVPPSRSVPTPATGTATSTYRTRNVPRAYPQSGVAEAAQDCEGNDEWSGERTAENDEDLEASRPQEDGRRERYDVEECTTLEGVGEELPEAEGNARLEEESVLSEDSRDYHEGDECSPGDKNEDEDDELASSETLAALGTDEDTTIEDRPEETTTTTTESATAGGRETTTCSSINVCNGENCHSLENHPRKIEPVTYGMTTERGPLPVENGEEVPPPGEGPAEGSLPTQPYSDEPSGENDTDPEGAPSAAHESALPEHHRLFSEDELDALEENASPRAKPELEEKEAPSPGAVAAAGPPETGEVEYEERVASVRPAKVPNATLVSEAEVASNICVTFSRTTSPEDAASGGRPDYLSGYGAWCVQ
uniref:Uncharacterized protein n=5 Tax=Phytophthora fragariae TaxID=53985 RepID=A0A6A3FM19_9STRA|nr:hypothetical protein PF009_g4095 [Phytophthora fragariae]